MKFLGDIVVVEHINIKSSVIEIPENVITRAGAITAKVLYIGKSFRHKDDIKLGDSVVVPSHLGTRNAVPNNPKAIVYDGEDIVAVLSP